MPVKVGGAVRDFSLANSTTNATIAAMGGIGQHPDLRLDHQPPAPRSWGATGSAVTLGVDAGSFTDCSLGAATIGAGQLTLSAARADADRVAAAARSRH